jgi:hypothetical protein
MTDPDSYQKTERLADSWLVHPQSPSYVRFRANRTLSRHRQCARFFVFRRRQPAISGLLLLKFRQRLLRRIVDSI